MTAVIESEVPTLADLHERLGCVPLERILLQPPPGTATEADVLAAEARPRKRLCELIDGILVEKAMGLKESFHASFLIEIIAPFVRLHKLGMVAGADGMIRLWPGRVRIPDVAYFSWDRLPNRKVPRQPIPQIAPDLAIEVLSPSNTKAEMEKKREDYFRVGVTLVWEIDPEQRIATVYTAPAAGTELSEQETLDGGTVLPGFQLPLATLFAELEREGS